MMIRLIIGIILTGLLLSACSSIQDTSGKAKSEDKTYQVIEVFKNDGVNTLSYFYENDGSMDSCDSDKKSKVERYVDSTNSFPIYSASKVTVTSDGYCKEIIYVEDR